ncbi:MAG: CDP-paratose 2-epimerase [Chlamydiales bacterium]|jgi:CDP-paratose 2-epimerase
MKYLITGACGFLGTNIAQRILQSNDSLVLFDNLSRNGSSKNLEWLQKQNKDFVFLNGDIRNYHDVENVITTHRPDVIFHLAGQVAMTTSLASPYKDFEINALGTLNVLEVVRKHLPETAIIYSSSNKVYGDFSEIQVAEEETRYVCPDHPKGFDESLPLEFHTPYGCSKGSADQYVLDYARMFGLKTVVFRHSTMYGTSQHATFDQGWIGWFCQQALEQKLNPEQEAFTISGTGKQVRDILFADDAVDCYMKASENIDSISGEAFNIGGAIKNSLSLLELFSFLEKKLNVQLKYTELPWRASDQKVFVCDNSKATKSFSWEPKTSSSEGIGKMLDWLQSLQSTSIEVS